jgi:alpha-ribazole phosphatase
VLDNQYLTTTIDLLRHGECGDGHCYRGSTDVALSAVGYQQMLSSVACLSIASWDRIVSSPLQRCSKFASELAAQQQKPIVLESGFKELCFGDWEGLLIDHVWKTQQVAVENWFADSVNFPPPNGERADDFFLRVQQSLINNISITDSESILFVVHGGVIRALLADCLSMSIADMNRFDVPYACLSRIQITYDIESKQYFSRLIAHNVTATDS